MIFCYKKTDVLQFHSTTNSSFTNPIPDLHPNRPHPPKPCRVSELLHLFFQSKVRPDELPENQIRPEVKMTLGLLGIPGLMVWNEVFRVFFMYVDIVTMIIMMNYYVPVMWLLIWLLHQPAGWFSRWFHEWRCATCRVSNYREPSKQLELF